MASAKKELKEVLREAESQGWEVRYSSKGHPMLYAPDGESIVTTGGTPSDHRALTNLISRLRRHGFIWKGR
jgi:hypothetical protein